MFTKYRKFYFIFSVAIAITCIVFLFVYGLKPGIDLTGGSIMEISYKDARPSNQEIRDILSQFDLGEVYVQPTGDQGVIIRMKDITEDTHQEILTSLSQNHSIEESRFESIGPVIGTELRQKTSIVAVAVLLSMIIYIAIAFRKVKRPLKSWQYGIASCIALFHDILIPMGVFSILGKFYNAEITIPVITALLAVLGYSINNTVVVFDRIRENLSKRGEEFEQIVNISIKQTLTRQINTSLTTLFVVFAIFFFGGVTLKYFSLALILGIVAGTFSSIFIAGNIMVLWYNLRYKGK
jgi:preprotein translocase subunit SecF